MPDVDLTGILDIDFSLRGPIFVGDLGPQGANDFEDAPDITDIIVPLGSSYTGTPTEPTPNASFTRETDEPFAVSLYGYTDWPYRTAWWKFVAPTWGTVEFDAELSASAGGQADAVLSVHEGDSVDALTVVSTGTWTGADLGVVSAPVRKGKTYYVQVGQYWLTLPGGGSAGDLTYVLRGRVTSLAAMLNPPAALASASTLPPIPVVNVSLAYPSNGQRIPILSPVLSFVVIAESPEDFDDATATIHVDTDPNFSDPQVLTTTIASAQGVATTVRSGLTLTEGARYFWRVKISSDAGDSAWSVVSSFVPDLSVGSGAAYAHWGNVNTDTPEPHLWYIHPRVGQPGEKVVLIGKGLDLVGLSVHFGPWVADVTSVTSEPAAAQAYTSNRTIAPASNMIDPEHEIIEAVVPEDLSPPGGSVWVEGG